MDRWGIIYSPKSGVRHTHRRWEEIRRCLNEKAVDYDFVQSEGSGSERRLAGMLAQNGYTTIVLVGGDMSLYHAVNGIAEAAPALLRTVRLGVIPNGHVNGFASFWGLQEDNPRQAVEALLRGRVRKVDLGVLEEGGREHYFLNCVNIGLVANIADIKHKTFRFWGLSGLSYLSSMVWLLFQRMETKMSLTVNHDRIEEKLMTVCIGNCQGYGQTPNAVPYNGMLDVSVISCPPVSQLFVGMSLLQSRRFLAFRNVRPYRTGQSVKIDDVGNSKISVDGFVMADFQTPMSVSVRKEQVSFIIPA